MDRNESLKIWTLLRPYRKQILLATILSLAASGASLLHPLIMKQMIDVALPRKDFSLLVLSVIGLVALPVVATMFQSMTKSFHNRIGGEITDKLNISMLSRLLRLSPRVLNEYHAGDVAVRLDRVEEIGDFFIKWRMLPMIPEAVSVIGLVWIMVSLDVTLALLSFGMLPIVVFIASHLGQKLEDNFNLMGKLRRGLQGYAVQLLGGIKTVQMLTREDQELSAQQESIRRFRSIRNDTFMIEMWRYDLLSSLERALGLGILFSVSIWAILKGKMTVGTLLAYTVYFPDFLESVKYLRSTYMEYKEIKPMLAEAAEILNLPVEITDSPDASPLPHAKGEIEFRNVSFAYREGQEAVRNISFHIRPGEFIGIVGPTGAGKSTILDLLLRFQDPEQGEILLDGRNIKEYKLHDLRSRIGLVTQDVFLWDKTIRDNLLYGNPDASFEELVHACDIAQVTPFLERLPDGWDTLIGERGVKLSGGEKQRLGIARILLRKPDILLMDEPTSALDAKTESRLQQALEQVFEGKTVIVVAHRLATIRHADRIFVVKDGTLAETGTQEELMQNRSVYWQLHTEQFEGPVRGERVG